MNTGTLASQAEIGGWVQALGPGMSAGGRRPFPLRESGVSPTEKKLRLYMQNPAIWCVFGRIIVRNAAHSAILNTLTMERRSHASPLEMTPALNMLL